MWAASCENVSSGICGQRRPRSACASTQSDQGLYSSLTESLDTTECMNGEQSPRCTLRLRRTIWICAFYACSGGTFLLDEAYVYQNTNNHRHIHTYDNSRQCHHTVASITDNRYPFKIHCFRLSDGAAQNIIVSCYNLSICTRWHCNEGMGRIQ